MLNCYKYNKKEVKKVQLNEVSFVSNEYFIDVNEPTNNEIKELCKKTGISSADFSYCLKDHVRPLIQNKKSYSFMTFKKVNANKTSDMCLFISRKFVIAVHSEKSDGINEVIKSSKNEDLVSWFTRGLPYVLFRVMLAVTRQYSKQLIEISNHVENMEQRIFLKANFRDDVKTLFFYKKSLLAYRAALIKNKDNVEDISEGVLDFITKKDIEYFNALKLELAEITGIIDGDIKSVQDAIDISIGMESNKLNQILRGFTIIATIILFPTLISGIWGMNFANIPFYNWEYGFFVPIILMVISVVILFIVFKLKKWS